MDLKNAKKGEQYRIFLTPNGEISPLPSMSTMVTTIIAESKKDRTVLLGWKKGEPFPVSAINRGNPSPDNDYVPNQASYVYGKSVDRSLPVAVQIVNGLDGFPCRKCTEFYQYALPNQTDGTLLCYRCRKGW